MHNAVEMRNLSPFAARLVPLEAQIAAFVSTHFGTEQEDNVSLQRKAHNFQPVFPFSLIQTPAQHLTVRLLSNTPWWSRWSPLIGSDGTLLVTKSWAPHGYAQPMADLQRAGDKVSCESASLPGARGHQVTVEML